MRKFEELKTYVELAWAGYKGFIKLRKSGQCGINPSDSIWKVA